MEWYTPRKGLFFCQIDILWAHCFVNFCDSRSDPSSHLTDFQRNFNSSRRVTLVGFKLIMASYVQPK